MNHAEDCPDRPATAATSKQAPVPIDPRDAPHYVTSYVERVLDDMRRIVGPYPPADTIDLQHEINQLTTVAEAKETLFNIEYSNTQKEELPVWLL